MSTLFFPSFKFHKFSIPKKSQNSQALKPRPQVFLLNSSHEFGGRAWLGREEKGSVREEEEERRLFKNDVISNSMHIETEGVNRRRSERLTEDGGGGRALVR